MSATCPYYFPTNQTKNSENVNSKQAAFACMINVEQYNYGRNLIHQALTRKSMAATRVLRKRNWTDAQLIAGGFRYFEPRKRLVMARVISTVTNIELTLETLMADAGDIICYNPGDHLKNAVDQYEHWPVAKELFKKTYKQWDDGSWRPNPAEAHLMEHGCLPYFKSTGVWALRLPISIYVQSLESPEPSVVPRGRWLCIGSEGEPYNMNDEQIHARYVMA
jgi:hypothetical protein